MYSFDQYGYLSDTPIPDRVTDVAPPDPADWPAGTRPNWTGYAWIDLPWPMPAPAAPPKPRRLTKLEFIRLFTDVEFATILAASKQSVALEAWYERFRLATPEPDGTSIDLDDPRTVGGVLALQQAGLLAPGRAAEILGIRD